MANSRAEAIAETITALQRAVSCISPTVLRRERLAHQPALLRADIFPVRLAGESRLTFQLSYTLATEQLGREPRSWEARCHGYMIVVKLAAGEELLAWHWHPN